MNPDNFEQRLQRQPQREIPATWREVILSVAKSASRPSPLASGLRLLSSLLAPRRAAWTGLAAAWIVILALNIAARDNTLGAQASRTSAPASPETMQALRQQRLLLAELSDRPESRAIAPPKPIIAPGPRSQSREKSAAV